MVDSMRRIQYSNHVRALEIGFDLLNNSNLVVPDYLLSQIYSTLGNIFKHQGYYGLAEEYYFMAMELHNAVGDSNAMGWLYVYIGNLNFKNELYSIADRNYYKALNIFKSIDFSEGISVVYNNLGLIYQNQNRLDEAMISFQKALGIRENIGDSTLIAHSFVYIGELYLKQDSIAKAISLFEQVLRTTTVHDSLDIKAKCYNNIATVNLLAGHDSLAEYYFAQAEHSFKETNNANFFVEFLQNRANLYLEVDDWQKSYYYLLEALQVANAYSLLADQIAIYDKLLMLPRTSVPNYDSAQLSWYRRLSELHLKLYKVEIDRNVLLIDIREELNNFRTKLELKELEDSKTMLLINTLIIIVILSVLLLVVLYIRFREKRSKDAIIAEQKELYFAQNLYMEEVKTERIKLKLAAEHRELVMKATFLQQKNKLITNFKKELKYQISLLDNCNTKGFNKLLATMNNSIKAEDILQDFERHFIDVHPGFLEGLSKNYPQLSAKDLKMCAYLKMNLDTKEIARITGVTVRSVQTSRYRLRIKLNIPKDVSLIAFFNA